jgi:hypothetical protein
MMKAMLLCKLTSNKNKFRKQPKGCWMKGALVFIAVFIILLLATLAYSELPPGAQIYDSFNFPTTDYQVFGSLPVRTLVSAVFNGVIYGIIVWIIYTVVKRASKPKPQQQKPASSQTQAM